VNDRANYLDSLNVELDNLSKRQASPTQRRRLAEVKAELDRYSGEPSEPRIEIAAPDGPISRSRRKS
jgi:hypothetical protein